MPGWCNRLAHAHPEQRKLLVHRRRGKKARGQSRSSKELRAKRGPALEEDKTHHAGFSVDVLPVLHVDWWVCLSATLETKACGWKWGRSDAGHQQQGRVGAVGGSRLRCHCLSYLLFSFFSSWSFSSCVMLWHPALKSPLTSVTFLNKCHEIPIFSDPEAGLSSSTTSPSPSFLHRTRYSYLTYFISTKLNLFLLRCCPPSPTPTPTYTHPHLHSPPHTLTPTHPQPLITQTSYCPCCCGADM